MSSPCGGSFLLNIAFPDLFSPTLSHAASLLFAGTKEDVAFLPILILTIAMH
jgi:hypothetical protein